MSDNLDKNTNPNYDWLFVKPEDRARQIQSMVGEIIQTNNNEEGPVKKELKELGDGVEYYDDSYLMDLISIMYSEENKKYKDEILELIETFSFVKDIRQSGQFIQIETDNGVIECASISETLRNSGKTMNDSGQSRNIEMFCRSIEYINSRQSNCHNLSISASEIFQNDFNTENQIVTGYPRYYVPENKYLHSWVELKIKGKDYVLDLTKNTIIDKASYYRLHHIDENEICSVISSEDIINDKRYFGSFIDILDSKTYLTTRHEIIRDLDKNRHLFDISDEDSGEAR